MFSRRDDLLNIYMTNGELDEIYHTLNSFGDKSIITEWGSGGSTVSWLYNLKPTQTFISIEHDVEWYNKVNNVINKNSSDFNLNNFKYYHIPKTSEVGPHAGQFDIDDGSNAYCDGPGDLDVFNSHVYFVDGLSRIKCIKNILKNAKNKSAVIYLHDYSSNKLKYDSILSLFPKHLVMDGKTSFAHNLMLKLWL